MRATVERPRSELTEFRREFWAYFAEQYPEYDIPDGYAASSFWVWIEAAELNLALYLAKDNVGVSVRGHHGESVAAVDQRLRPWETELRDRLGIEIGKPTASGNYAYSRSDSVDTGDRGNWPKLAEWLHTKITDYRQVLEATPAPPPAG